MLKYSLRPFHLCQNSISPFMKKLKFLRFHAVVLMKTFLLMYRLLATYCMTDIDEARVI